jgi:S-adenosylmethionine decarboxylase
MMPAMDGGLVGRHLIVELGGCDRARLDDPETIRGLIRAAAEAAGTRLLSEVVHRFTPAGVTGLGLLAESHLAVHTWPERGYAAVDLLTCRPDGVLDVEAVVRCLRAALGARDADVRLIERRLP